MLITVASTSPELRRIAEQLAARINQVTGFDTQVFAGNFKTNAGINFITSKGPTLGVEGFHLEITPQQIIITAEQNKGFTNGVKKLLQLMPPEMSGSTRATHVKWVVVCCYVEG